MQCVSKPHLDTLSCIVPIIRMFGGLCQVKAEWHSKHPQRSIDLFKREKRERLTEWLSRFIVHHAARDCASVSRRVILGDILFHNAAVTEYNYELFRYLLHYIYNGGLCLFY